MAFRTLAQAAAFGEIAGEYQRLRAAHPTFRALTIHRYIHDDQGMSLEQFQCETERGHTWGYTGTAYGGDDERFHGEGRCYCTFCGRDGDA